MPLCIVIIEHNQKKKEKCTVYCNHILVVAEKHLYHGVLYSHVG